MRYAILTFVLSLTTFGWSQNFYGSLSGGYQYILSTDQPPSIIVNEFHQISSPWFRNLVDYQFEHAFSANASLGYVFNSNFGVELTGSFLKPQAVINDDPYTNRTFSMDFWRVSPKFVVHVPTKSFLVSTKIGPNFGYGKATYFQEFTNNGEMNLSPDHSTLEYEYTAPISYGFNASVGVSKLVAKRLIVFADLEFVHQNFSPTKGKMTQFTMGDENYLEEYDYAPYYSEIEFGDETDSPNWGSPNPEVAQKQYKRNYSLSGVGVQVGVKFVIWRKVKEIDHFFEG